MANPIMLFENRIGPDYYTTIAATSEASGFPIENVEDWRPGTAYRWKAGSTATQNIDINIASGTGNPRTNNTLAIAGHNLGTIGATVKVWAEGVTPPVGAADTTYAFTAGDPDVPLLLELSSPLVTAQYWRVQIYTATAFSAAPQIGVMALGRKLEFTAGALTDLDPYHRQSKANLNLSNNGSPIGVDVRSKMKRFKLSYGGGDPGMGRDDFFTTITPSFEDFLDHGVDAAKPFFFAWNIDVDATGETYLCHVADYDVSMPFVGSTKRRGLQATLLAYRETT